MNWIEAINEYIPYNEQEESDKNIILDAINSNNNILTRDNKIMHMTSSGYIVNKTKDKVLMIYHKIYQSWSWTGGHTDGDNNLLCVAIKEAKEETGLDIVIPLTDKIFSIDILPVNGHYKKDSFISPHLHLSIAYLLEADENAPLIVNEEETEGVKWIPIKEISSYCTELEMIKLYSKFNNKLKDFN